MSVGPFGKYLNGFRLLNALETGGLIQIPVANGQAVTRGRVVGWSSGYCQQITSLQESGAKVVAGIAYSTNTAAEASSAGVLNVEVVPLHRHYRFMVPVEANALITQAAVGTIVDLQSANTIDIADLVTLGLGFVVDDIDVSAQAVAANTYGFAIGHFDYVAAS